MIAEALGTLLDYLVSPLPCVCRALLSMCFIFDAGGRLVDSQVLAELPSQVGGHGNDAKAAGAAVHPADLVVRVGLGAPELGPRHPGRSPPRLAAKKRLEVLGVDGGSGMRAFVLRFQTFAGTLSTPGFKGEVAKKGQKHVKL